MRHFFRMSAYGKRAVYALYQRSRIVAALLLALFVGEEVAVAISLGSFLPKLEFNDFCIAKTIPTISIVIGHVIVFLQLSQ
jgi:hypothetical protein